MYVQRMTDMNLWEDNEKGTYVNPLIKVYSCLMVPPDFLAASLALVFCCEQLLGR